MINGVIEDIKLEMDSNRLADISQFAQGFYNLSKLRILDVNFNNNYIT
jgi:hypothetical protein